MIALLQRVDGAEVRVGDEEVGAIGRGALVLVGVERSDGTLQAKRLLERLLGYRIFPDESGRMNRSLRDIAGELLLVPQFTLAADTCRGNRPSFAPAAEPRAGKALFDHLVELAQGSGLKVASGRFGADMKVMSINDGPVTFWLHVSSVQA